jgi:hypothetical protein
MAVKWRRTRSRKNNSKETASEARLAPPEERGGGAVHQPASNNNDGTLVLNTGQLKLPQQIKDEEEDGSFLSIDPAVLILLCFSLIFIAVIAYIIWNGWEPPR